VVVAGAGEMLGQLQLARQVARIHFQQPAEHLHHVRELSRALVDLKCRRVLPRGVLNHAQLLLYVAQRDPDVRRFRPDLGGLAQHRDGFDRRAAAGIGLCDGQQLRDRFRRLGGRL